MLRHCYDAAATAATTAATTAAVLCECASNTLTTSHLNLPQLVLRTDER